MSTNNIVEILLLMVCEPYESRGNTRMLANSEVHCFVRVRWQAHTTMTPL